MIPYDEGQITAFIDDATALYGQAHRSPDPHALIWVARVQFDACTIGYPASRATHLNELRIALGFAPVAVANTQPPNVATADRDQVTALVTWWLDHIRSLTPSFSDPVDLWVGYVMDDAGEGHTKGWTADFYWPNKMLAAAGLPLAG